MTSPSISHEMNNTRAAVIWAFSRTWGISKSLLLLVLSTGLVRSLIPLGMALAGRELINAVTAGAEDRVLPWLGASMFLALAMAAAVAVFKYSSQRLKAKLDLEIVHDVMQRVSDLEFALLENNEFQDILHQVRQNAGLHFSLFMENTVRVVSNGLIGAGFIVILVSIAPEFCLFAIPIAVLYLFFQLFLARKGYQEEKDNVSKWRWNHYYISQISEADSAAEIRLLSLSPVFLGRFRKIMQGIIQRGYAVLKLQLAGDLAFALILVTLVYFFLSQLIQGALSGELTIGDMVLFAGATTQLRMMIQTSMAGAGEIRKSLFHISALIRLYEYEASPAGDGDRTPPHNTGELDLKGVYFSYPGGTGPALDGVSLRLKQGETLALVGENGAGKTTLVKLLGRLYLPDQGSILVDGLDVRHWRTERLHQRFSFALQYFGRFEGSAAENIAFGNWPELKDNPRAVERTAREAGVHDMVSGLPRGYETQLGWLFGEHVLSGGQWQQIALARAFSRKDSILILDEPTANLDAMTEYRIFQRFSEIAASRTALIISHRFATVSMADRIAVMAKGKIAEIGSHPELMALDGIYAAMYKLQASALPQSGSG